MSIKSFFPKKLKTFLRLIYTTRNWFTVCLVKAGLKKNCTAVMRNDHRIKVSRDFWAWDAFIECVNLLRDYPNVKISEDSDGVRFDYRGRDFIFKCGKFGLGLPLETFFKEPYRRFVEEFDIRDRTVIDIGANIGQSAIYFAGWGAKHVYSYEPMPGQFLLAKDNIKANGFENKCDIFLAGVSAKTGSFLDDPEYEIFFGADPHKPLLLEALKPGEKIPLVTLEEIAKRFDVQRGFMKCDCEGYEYEIFSNASNEVLRRFDCIVLEYHYGVQDLEARFRRAGFFVEHTEPMFDPRPLATDGRSGAAGYVFAYRNIK